MDEVPKKEEETLRLEVSQTESKDHTRRKPRRGLTAIAGIEQCPTPYPEKEWLEHVHVVA